MLLWPMQVWQMPWRRSTLRACNLASRMTQRAVSCLRQVFKPSARLASRRRTTQDMTYLTQNILCIVQRAAASSY